LSLVRSAKPKRNQQHHDVCWIARKPKHAKRKQALTAKAHAEKNSGIQLRVYRCPHCGDFHLTSQVQTGTRA
jgi:hypothetical protein